jgi:site-specific DNA-methyltransferase (adenine-specific)
MAGGIARRGVSRMPDNFLYYGDNLDVMRRHAADESVDLVYLDPPFKSNQDYNVLFEEKDGSRSAAQIKAFEDTWQWDQSAEAAYEEVVELGIKTSESLQAFRMLLGTNDMMAYLVMMAPRLLELRRVLKPTGSIYLHCDPTASHYLKMLMDSVFDPRNFRNEIVWRYKKYQKAEMRYFTRNSDRILFYVRTPEADTLFKPQFIQLEKPKRFLKRVWDKKTSRIVNAKDDEGHVQYMEVDKEKIDDVWTLTYLMPAAHERLGYPTQKPEALLERLISASSNKGDTVLDPFCGCGTTIATAHRLQRRWIGIDITHVATSLIKFRLRDTFGDDVSKTYEVIGEPVSLPDAQDLADTEPYQFQAWALGLVGARQAELKKGSDKGIDGKLYFHDEGQGGKTKQVVFSVKAGHTGPTHVRDLRGVVEREKAAIGVLLTMQKTTKPMRSEAASAGFYVSPFMQRKHPKIQILTIEDLLSGSVVDMPPWHTNVTHKKAPKAKREADEHQPETIFEEAPQDEPPEEPDPF